MMIAGLGNPGGKYARNRHNVGFLFVDYLAERSGAGKFKYQSAFDAEVTDCRVADQKVWLVKPQAFMNLSGSPVSRVASYYKIDPGHVLVVYDDVALPFGYIRVRPHGSAGGHNGMKSIIGELGTQAFPRIRIGIAREGPRGSLARYVLSDFNADERAALPEVLAQCNEALELVLRDDVSTAMSRFNRRVLKEEEEPETTGGGDDQS